MAAEYREREKLSWAEIDKRKNRSSHTRRDREARPEFEDKRALNKYKEKLEAMFAPEKKVPKEGQEELKKIRETSDRAAFIELSNAYLASYGLPVAWEDLENFLRHKDPQVLAETIRRMETILPEQSATRRGNFEKDLHLIEMTTRDKDLRKQVSALLKTLTLEPAPAAGK